MNVSEREEQQVLAAYRPVNCAECQESEQGVEALRGVRDDMQGREHTHTHEEIQLL